MNDEKFANEQSILKKVRNMTFITAGIYIVAGIALIAAPVQMNSVLGFLLGALSFCLGIYRLVVYFRHQRIESVIATDLFLGILLAVLGFICLIYHNQVMTYITVIFGVFLIFGSVIKIQDAMILQKIGHMNWWLPLICGLVSLIFSVLVIMKPAFIENVFLILVGAFLLYDGATTLGTGFMGEIFQRQVAKGITTGWGHPPVPGAAVGTQGGNPMNASAQPYSGSVQSGFSAAEGNMYQDNTGTQAPYGAEQGMSAIPAPEKEKKKFSFFGLFKKKESTEGPSFDAEKTDSEGVETLHSAAPQQESVPDAVYEQIDEQTGAAASENIGADEESFSDAPGVSPLSPDSVYGDSDPYVDPLPELRPDPIQPGEELPPAHFDPETGEKLD